uniref:hypothetical protein n=1 Tax=Clostridium sp. TaxID=1506 RepID=UPI00307C7B95
GNYISHAKVHAANIKRNAANKIECPSKRNKASWGEDYKNPDKQCKKTHRNSIHNTHLTLTLYSYTFDYSIQNIPCP